MKKIHIISAILLIGVLCIQSLNAQNIYFNFKDGSSATYAISDIRTITFTDSIMHLNKWDGSILSWNVNAIGNYNYTGTTGILPEALAKEISIFPNPGNGPLTIQYQITGAQKMRLDILDLGKVIFTETQCSRQLFHGVGRKGYAGQQH